MIKLIIFDLDGTLLNSIDVIVQSFKKAAELLGVNIDLNVVRNNIGIPSREILNKALKTKVDEHLMSKFLTLRRRLHDELIMNAKLFEDALPTLIRLKERGYKLALVSSNVRYRLERILERNKIRDFFDVVVSYEDVKRPKPYPDMVLKALEEIKVDAKNTVLVGDSINDIISAKRAGVTAILIDRKGVREKLGEDFRISSLKELSRLIKKLDC